MELDEIYKAIIEQMASAAIIDREGRYIYANAGWEKQMGRSLDSVKGCSAQEIVKKSRVMEAMETGKPILTTPVLLDGREMFSSYHPIWKNGEVIGCFIQIIFGNIDDALMFSNSVTHIRNELAYYKKELQNIRNQTMKYKIEDIAGESIPIQQMKQQIRMAANSQSTVLITGETGSGKELVAHAIHALSHRRDAPFIKINCAAIPPELAESEFFGYEYGAFTGAKKGGKEGIFETANHGSLFLDEINQMSYFIQPKILRALQEFEITRVGGKASIPVDVRIIAASNQQLEDLVSEKKFRQDLFYRLNVVRVRVPPLRERLDDIPLLVNDAIRKLNHRLGTRVEGVTPDVIKLLQSYNWPGNIRELQNVVEQAFNVKGSGVLDSQCFQYFVNDRRDAHLFQRLNPGSLEQKKRELEKTLITEAYKNAQGNKRKTAEYLGISRPMLYQRLKEYGLIP